MVRGEYLGGRRNIVGEQILMLRKGKRMSQKDLAARLQVRGCDLSELSVLRIEQGIRLVRDVELYDLCKVLRVTPDQLLGFDNTE